MFTKVEITQCFLVSQLPISLGRFSTLRKQVWTKKWVREWFALSLCSLSGEKKGERDRDSERLIAMTETWVVCGFLFPDCPQDDGDISDTVTGAHCPYSPQCSLGNF